MKYNLLALVLEFQLKGFADASAQCIGLQFVLITANVFDCFEMILPRRYKGFSKRQQVYLGALHPKRKI
jgi:hypothetical protein